MILKRAAFVLSVVSVLAGCSVKKRDQQTALTVELDVYSGRPNPTWTLSEEESADLAARLKGLPAADAPPPEGGLGYRGFLISNLGRAGGLLPRIRVGRGLVSMEEDGPLRVYRDTHGIERWLLEQASRRGYRALVESILPKK